MKSEKRGGAKKHVLGFAMYQPSWQQSGDQLLRLLLAEMNEENTLTENDTTCKTDFFSTF